MHPDSRTKAPSQRSHRAHDASRRRAHLPPLRHVLVGAWIIVLLSMSVGTPSGVQANALVRTAARAGTVSSTATPLAINLDDLAQSSSVVFTDAMKQASPWSSTSVLSLDAAGNVTKLAAGQSAQTVIFPFAAYPSGDYTLLYDGSGQFLIDPRSGTITNVANRRATVHITSQLGFGIHLSLTATNAHNYVRNVRLILPGFASIYQSQPFTPAFLAQVAPFNVLRFVHWSRGDTSAAALTWPMRSTVTQFSQAGPNGVAWEYQIALANAVGADPWFVVPVGATNFYVTQLAALVQARLDPRLHPMFEYADGAWRPGSPNNAYATMAGRNFGLATDAQTAAIDWYAQRSAQVFALVQEVFGADADRVVRVLGGAAALPHSAADTLDRTLFARAGAAQGIDAFAVDASTANPAALRYTRTLFMGTRLGLIASGGALSFTSTSNVTQATRTDLNTWHNSGGGLFAASSLTTYLAATGLLSRVSVAAQLQIQLLRTNVFNAFMQLYPAAHVVPRPQAMHSVLAPQTTPNTYVPPGGTYKGAQAVVRANAAAGTDLIAINAGGPAVGSWAANEYYSTHDTWTYATTSTISTTGVTNPAPEAVYQSQFTGGGFTYTIPGFTPGAAYTVRLHFAELFFTGAGKRVFNVAINGTQVLNNLDVYAVSGGEFKAIAESINATANGSGQIVITFTGVTNNPIVNGIEVQVPATTDLLAINAGGPAVGSWAANEFASTHDTWSYTTATTVSTSGVTNPAPEAVYQSQYTGGGFTYTLPGFKSGTAYTVRLHFAELFFKAAGQRVFDVAVNGTPVLTKFDVYAASGGEFKAVVENVSATANSSGQIVLSFTAVANYPVINGIEVQGSGGGTPTPTPTPTSGPTTAPANIITYHSDNLRSGWYKNETILNTTNVASSSFGLRKTLSVDGIVLAQPLYVPSYPVNGVNHNLLMVVTENDSVYAFDADSGAVLWHKSMGTPQASADVGCPDVEPSYGITSTPVINRATGTMYLVYNTEPSSMAFHTYLAALNLSTGDSVVPSVEIAASAVQSNGSKVSFNPALNQQRPSLLLANNSLYLGVGSHCDYGISQISGWLLRYSTANLSQLAAFPTVEDGVAAGDEQLGSIWGGGFGPAADAAGNIYAVTGNGPFDVSSGGHNYGMSVVKYAPDLSSVSDYFSYSDEAADDAIDADFGSGGTMLLPTQSGSVPNILVALGKAPNIWLLNQANLGHFSSTNAGALQKIALPSSYTNQGVWGGPAYYGGFGGPKVYYQASESALTAYSLSTGSGNPKLTLTSTGPFSSRTDFGGDSPIVSSNGSTAGTGIVWAIRCIWGPPAAAKIALDAYDATNVSHHLFGAPVGVWSHSHANAFVTPLVANGKVYAGGYKTVYVFGLAP